MRTIVFSAAFTLALALLGTTATNAAPANGAALGNAVKTDSVVHQFPARCAVFAAAAAASPGASAGNSHDGGRTAARPPSPALATLRRSSATTPPQ